MRAGRGIADRGCAEFIGQGALRDIGGGQHQRIGCDPLRLAAKTWTVAPSPCHSRIAASVIKRDAELAQALARN